MSARAPGKAFLTGAYAVLEGAPAVVLAVDRFAEAKLGHAREVAAEVAVVARLLDAPAPIVDVGALAIGGRKVGLGSSAAAAVAAAACILGSRGVGADTLSARSFEIASRAHAEVQPRGSGGDVAASAFGTVVVERQPGGLVITRARLPRELSVAAFTTARATRTSSVLDRVAERRAEPAVDHAFSALSAAAHAGARSFLEGRLASFLEAAAAHVEALDSLGRALELSLVPPEVELARPLLDPRDVRAGTSRSIVLLPSGAGGGDTVLWLGARAPSDEESAAFARVGLVRLPLAPTTRGVALVAGA